MNGAERAALRDPAFRKNQLQIVKREIKSGDIENMCSAAQKIANALGAPNGGEYGAWLKESVGALVASAPAVLAAIKGLDAPLATTNYDRLLESYTDLPAITLQDGGALNVLNGDHRGILHLHGVWDKPESVVLGARSYLEVMRDERAQEILHAMRLTRTLLFVGCGSGLEDPNFEQFRAWLARVVSGSVSRAYRLARHGEVLALRKLHQRDERIVVLDYGDEYADLIPFLNDLGPSNSSGVSERSSAYQRGRSSLTPGDASRLRVELWKQLSEEYSTPGGKFAELLEQPDTAYVEVSLREETRRSEALGESFRRARTATLDELLRRENRREHASRWVIVGDPGAGKSTLARALARRLNGNRTAVAIYTFLPTLVEVTMHPFDLAERELALLVGEERSRGLASVLEALAAQPRGVYLLFDGFDELGAADRSRVGRHLRAWARALPQVPIAVFSRPVDFESLGPDFPTARVQLLDEELQRRLLLRWLGLQSVDAVLAKLRESPSLVEAARAPMLLALLAYLFKSGAATPTTRLELYDRALDTLLRSEHRDAPSRAVSHPIAARRILGELSLALQEENAEVWRMDVLADVLRRLREHNGVVGKHWERAYWAGSHEFLEDVSQHSGILGPHDGSSKPWRFLHRQFRELLAAEALAGQSREELLARARRIERGEMPRWAESLAFTCELAGRMTERPAVESFELLQSLFAANATLALRVLAELENIDPIEALDRLVPPGGWDGDFLVKYLGRWEQGRGLSRDKVVAWLWRQVTLARTVLELAHVHYVLEKVSGEVDRVRFFSSCGRWPPQGPPPPDLVTIREGKSMMGSPREEPEREENERLRQVKVCAFRLSAVTVTNEEYERLDPEHARETFNGRLAPEHAARHPVVNVSWWEARLYARWLGMRLPREAEWEYACRAGKRTPFSFGETVSPRQVDNRGASMYDDASAMQGGSEGHSEAMVRKGVHASGPKPEDYRQQTVTVGSLPANAWGFYEMHGNVWEWCEDWYGEYSDGDVSDPRGPESGEERVIRGGSWVNWSGHCRSAYRQWARSLERRPYAGFRIAADAPRSPHG